MASRTTEEVLNILRPRENVLYFGSDDSEEEVDLLEDHDSDGTEYEVTDLEDDRDDVDVSEPEPELPTGTRRRKYVYGKDNYKWCVDAPENRGRRCSVTVILPQDKRKRCFYCKTEKDRKTNICCAKCAKPTCDEHRISCCISCYHN